MFLPFDFEDYVPSDHAELRMAQRNVSFEDIIFVLEYGCKKHRAGAVFYCLRRCDIPRNLWRELSRLEGTIVVLSGETNTIITVYRNRRKGLGNVKRKGEYNNPPKHH